MLITQSILQVHHFFRPFLKTSGNELSEFAIKQYGATKIIRGLSSHIVYYYKKWWFLLSLFPFYVLFVNNLKQLALQCEVCTYTMSKFLKFPQKVAGVPFTINYLLILYYLQQ